MPESEAKVVIWDMDGVIVDTAPYHLKAWQTAFAKRGIEFTKEDFKRSFGQRNDAIIKGILGKEVSEDEINSIASEKEVLFRQSVRQGLKPLPGVIELMESLVNHGIKMALASSAPLENIKLLTEGLAIERFFQETVSEKDVTDGKPSPQGFLLAAERLGAKPGNCIVIEDAVAGVMAAKRAGMFCLAVTNTHPGVSLSEADLIVDTLEAVSFAELEELINFKKQV